jgi:hypothetical protein
MMSQEAFGIIVTRVGQPGFMKKNAMGVRTRFGDLVDVRHRGALRLARLVGIQPPQVDAPAVVRLWNGDTCKELSVAEARALAAQLVDAAAYAELQNMQHSD